MLVPHSKTRPLNFKIPFIGIFFSIILCCSGIVYLSSIAVNTFEYHRMKETLNYYSQQFYEMKSTITSLRRAESEFKRLFSVGSKEKVLESMDTPDSGAIDMDNLGKEIRKTVETVGEIRDYLHIQRDIYIATPKGFPVSGEISSHYGRREHPRTGGYDFHTGLDVSATSGSPVRATADGIVSFSGWNGGSGNLVVLEHGHGFSTFYAHNKKNNVAVGQKVKRGDVIGYVGSTGFSTGPHLHYEIWKHGRSVNPADYVKGRS
jgi:murein DD-endopeptidase MepM/ murein hydrolase activator NlpD